MQGRVAITVVPRLFDVLPATANLHDLGSGLTGISVAPVSFGWGSRVAKRTIDLVGAVTALLLLSPLLLILALAIRQPPRGLCFSARSVSERRARHSPCSSSDR